MHGGMYVSVCVPVCLHMQVGVTSVHDRASFAPTLKMLIGEDRFAALDCCLAGDEVPARKPNPAFYAAAAKKLGLQPAECVVVEGCEAGLSAARGAGMRCIITYTPATKSQVRGQLGMHACMGGGGGMHGPREGWWSPPCMHAVHMLCILTCSAPCQPVDDMHYYIALHAQY